MTENIPVCMIRENLDDIPQHELPVGFTLRPYQPGDEAAWLAIHLEADQYNVITPDTFTEQFGADAKMLAERQFYLCDGTGQAIGTATAWFNTYRGQAYGRVHWVAIVPAMQGRGLAKPLLTALCHRLRRLGHQRAYLTTESARLPAINLYLRYGFTPDIRSEQEAQAWQSIGRQLGLRLG